MKIDRAISIELGDGQKLTLNLKEAAKLARTLEKFLGQVGDGRSRRRRGRKRQTANANNSAIATATKGKKRGRPRGSSSKSRRADSTKRSKRTTSSATTATIRLSDGKRQEILDHVNKEISDTPRTLSNLLKGASFSQSQIPAIRELVESQQNIRAKAKGKRTVYLKRKARKATTATPAAAPENQAAATTSA